MKKKKTTNDSPNTAGGQTINNNAAIHKQINIHTFNGNISGIADEVTKPSKTAIEQIKEAISLSETDKAVTLLKEFLDKHHKDRLDDAILIESRWQHLKKEKYKGVLEVDDYNKQQNRIHESLIGFMTQLLN